jgi:hypothetical protein
LDRCLQALKLALLWLLGCVDVPLLQAIWGFPLLTRFALAPALVRIRHRAPPFLFKTPTNLSVICKICF